MKNFFRYESVEYATIGIDGEFTSPKFPNPKLELKIFNLHKETPKGFWIGYGYSGLKSPLKWVSKTAKKRYAYPTEQEALINFIKRNERRIEIIQYQIDSCIIGVNIAKEKLEALKTKQT